jgi:cyclopropane fatty-acyl-phospholipid synthase-like methyltransferase
MNGIKTDSKDVKHLYNESYFLNDATGHLEFIDFKGKFEQLIDKFQFAIGSLGLNSSHSLLDIGCGRGEIVIYHAMNGGKAEGVDFSEDAISLAKAKAKELGADCKFHVISFEYIPEEFKYDRIVANDFIEHISEKESLLFINKCSNLLNKGGRLVIFTYPNTLRRKYGYRIIRLFSIIKNKPLPERETDTTSDHYKQYHLNEQNYFTLKKLAAKGGFKNVRVIYFDRSIKDSIFKKILVYTPFRHLILKGLTMIAEK